MPSDPNIILGIKPPPEPPNPLAIVGQLSQLRNQQADAALRTAQLAQTNANTADIQQQTASRNRLNQSWAQASDILKDPAEATKYGAGDMSSFQKAGIDPTVVDALRKNQAAAQTATSAKNTADLAFGQEQLKGITAGITGIRRYAADNPGGDLPAQYAQWRDTATAALKLKPDTLPASITQLSDLDPIALRTSVYEGVHNAEQADRASTQKIATDKSDEARNLAQTAQYNADAAKLIQDKQTALATLPGIIAKAQNDTADAAFRAAHAGLSAEQAQTGKIEQGKLNVTQAEQNVRQKTFDATYGPDAKNQGLLGVQPHLVIPATAAFTKAGEEYATAVHANDEMTDLIGLARKGNKLAYAYAPTTGVLTINSANGSKRVNLNEINAYGGAGSDFDKIQRFFTGHLEGKKIDDSILGNMQAVHDSQLRAAQNQYANKVTVVNGAYGSKFQPVNLPTAGGSGTVNMRAPNGSIKPVAAANVAHYKSRGAVPVP